jgi:hypothetical protein
MLRWWAGTMNKYTIHDLMILAGIDEGEPRQVDRVGSEEPPYLPDQFIYAEDGDEFDLTYDDGRDFQTVRVQV